MMNYLKCLRSCFWSTGLLLVLMIVLVTPVLFSGSSSQQAIKRSAVVNTSTLKIMKGDLTIKITQCPHNVVKAGEELQAGFVVEGKSTFPGAVNNVVVDIILTSKPTYPVPAPYAVYSPHYTDNVLLKGGRENISFAGPGTVNVKLNGTNTIPADTPGGIYYLGAVIDAGNKISESDEKNNVSFCRIKVIGRETKKMPDLIVPAVDFKKVKQMVDVKGNQYWIFNVIITVKNQGTGTAGPFNVFLQRNNGPNSTYIKACLTCDIPVSGLGAGQSLTLPPRQFNNANNVKRFK